MAWRESSSIGRVELRQLVESQPAVCQHCQLGTKSPLTLHNITHELKLRTRKHLQNIPDVDQTRPGGLAGLRPSALLPVAGAGLAPPADLLHPQAGGQQEEAQAGQ